MRFESRKEMCEMRRNDTEKKKNQISNDFDLIKREK